MLVKPHKDYEDAIVWVLRERGGARGHPPRSVSVVSGWKVTQLISFLFNKPPSMVAADLIDMDMWLIKERR